MKNHNFASLRKFKRYEKWREHLRAAERLAADLSRASLRMLCFVSSSSLSASCTINIIFQTKGFQIHVIDNIFGFPSKYLKIRKYCISFLKNCLLQMLERSFWKTFFSKKPNIIKFTDA